MSETPLTLDEFAEYLSPLTGERCPQIAVGVSGGADSLALTLLMAKWAAFSGGRVVGVTVDHRIRPEAATEAAYVARVLEQFGIEHRTLRWTNGPAHPTQHDARLARYSLLADLCQSEGLTHLALAHHLEDQAETVLIRAKADSGPDGLAGMPATRQEGATTVIRPLLNVHKSRLKATLRAMDVRWVEDPSNDDTSYERVRVRKALPSLAEQGITAEQLAGLASAMGHARQRIEKARNRLIAEAVTVQPSGYAIIDRACLEQAPHDVAARALTRVLSCVGGSARMPQRERVHRLTEEVGAGLTRTRTLGGCQVIPRRDTLLVAREWENAPTVTVHPGKTTYVDSRFEARVRADYPRPLVARPIGRENWSALTQADRRLKKMDLPGAVRPGLYGIFDGGQLIDVPDLPVHPALDHDVMASWRHAPQTPMILTPFVPTACPDADAPDPTLTPEAA